ncbi:MAG: hypothetical protein ABUL62_00520 [Myxococcales bacterium]
MSETAGGDADGAGDSALEAGGAADANGLGTLDAERAALDALVDALTGSGLEQAQSDNEARTANWAFGRTPTTIPRAMLVRDSRRPRAERHRPAATTLGHFSAAPPMTRNELECALNDPAQVIGTASSAEHSAASGVNRASAAPSASAPGS